MGLHFHGNERYAGVTAIAHQLTCEAALLGVPEPSRPSVWAPGTITVGSTPVIMPGRTPIGRVVFVATMRGSGGTTFFTSSSSGLHKRNTESY